MLDDPFVLPHQRPSSSHFGHGGNGSSTTTSTSAAAASNNNSAPYSLLLSGHASKFKSSGGGGIAARSLVVVGKENGLLPSPRFGSSSSSSSSSSSAGGGPSSSSSPPRDGESSLLRKSLKPALKRRVTFSPTPLASLQSSPSHGKRSRPPPADVGLLFADEHERDAKRRRRRRENVYSDNPLLEAARGAATAAALTSATSRRPFGGADNDAEHDAESGSDVRPGGDSSPPPVPSPELRLVPLPRSPPRPRTKPTPVNFGSYSTSFAPFSLVNASAVPPNPQATEDAATDANADAAAEATDSEEESEQVESLLLPASVSPKKPSAATRPPTSADPALVLPPKHHLLDPCATFPSLAGAGASGSSSSSSSSSPLRSPSMTLSRSARPTTSLLLPDPPLRSILKHKAPSGNFIVKDEREGLRKNGRGRRHVVGWDGEKKLKATREKRLDEQAVKVAAVAAAAREAQDDDAADAGGKDKGKGKAKEGVSASSSAPQSSSARATRSSARASRSAATGLGNGGDGDDEPPRRRRGAGAGAGAPASSSSASNGAGSAAPPPPSRKRDPTRIKYELKLDDPAQLRAPLLVLRASLETRSSPSGEDEGEAALPPVGGNGLGSSSSSSLLPRPLATAAPLAPISTQQQTTTGPTIGNILTLNDVENAYVSLKNAVFCLPSVLADEQASLEPLQTHGQALLAALTRDVENVKSFPLWVAEQPRPQPDSDDLLMVDADAPTGDADEPSSSPSLNRRAAANPAAAVGPGAKASLTDAQMRRMRDELGTAQAAVKCAAACLRDARVVALFPAADLAKLVETVMSVALAPDLSVSVQRDFFPFLPFFLSSVAAATSAALPDLVPTILPSLRATLTLDPRVDRFRQSLSESLDALAVLLPLHGQMMLDSQVWRLWLREAAMGLWDGTKKMISTHDKAVKVLGRVVRILTVPVQTLTWNVERESVHAAISRDLHALLTSSPPGAGLDPSDETKQRRLTYLQTLLSQLEVPMNEKARAAETHQSATKQMATVSVLALVPALLGAEFRSIVPKGIGPWLRAFNTLSTSPSTPVLVLSALAWPHLAFAFLRVPVQPNGPWMLRADSFKPVINYLSMFKSRVKCWQRALDPTLDDERKEEVRLHAKALALAFCGVIYGATIYIRYGASSVRTANDPPDVPPDRLPMLDRVFKEMLEVYLPTIAKSEASHECNIIAWQILARICRTKSSSERPALLESLINPIFLDGTLASIAPDSAKMNVLLDAAIQRSIKPAAIPGWSEQWLVANVAQVLELFEKCLPDDVDQDADESLAVTEMSNAWRNLMRTLAGHPLAFSQAIQWLTRLSLEKATLAASLWTSLFTKGTGQYLGGVEAAMMADSRALDLATKCLLAATDRRAGFLGVLAKVAGRRLAQLGAGERASQDLQTAMALLRELAKAEAPEELAKDQFRLGKAIIRLVWSSDKGSLAMREHVRGALTSPDDDGASLTLRLCLSLVAGAQRLDEPVRQDVLTFCGTIALSALSSDKSSTNVELIASMLRCACDASYPHFYESVLEYLRSTVAPTGDTLERFAPLLVEPLRRAIELATSAPDVDTQALLQASLVSEEPIPAHLQLIQSFEEFWRGTFAPLEEEVDLPADLSGLLHVVRAIVHIPDAAETAETCSSTPTDSMPVPAQVAVAVPDGCRTTASEERVVSSRGGYEADVSHLPPQPGSAPASELEQDSASRPSQSRKVVSLSLRAPTADRADLGIDSPLAVQADTQMVDETQSDVLTREANASYAAMSSRVISQGTAESAAFEHDAHTDHAGKVPNIRKRLRSSTASGSDVASSTEDSTSDTSSGRKRVGKRRRNAAARREIPSMSGLAGPATVASFARAGSVQNDSQADQHDLSSTADSHDPATEDIVRSFLSLPIDTVVSVGKRLGGSPSLRRLIDLGERARDYFERMNSASP